MKKTLIIVVVLLFALFAFAGCSGNSAGNLANDATLTISGDGVDISLSAKDMQDEEMQTFTCTNIDSNGEVTEVTVTGFSFGDLLAANGIALSDVASINFIGSDGYMMAAPAEEFADSDVYILINYDGDDLAYPRSCIPDKRAMYWVKELAEIELDLSNSGSASNEIVDQISIFREGITELEGEELGNKGEYVLAYSLEEYFDTYIGGLVSEPLTMIAGDGFEKTETAEVFFSNYVTVEEQEAEAGNTPLYFSEDLSTGMRVKQLDFVIAGSDAVYFGKEISVTDLFDAVGMGEAKSYTFIASDGFELEVPSDAIEYGKITEDEEGHIQASFDDYDWKDTKGDGKIKYLLNIQANGIITGEDSTDTSATGDVLLKCFVGEEKVFISEAEFLALPQIEKELTKTNSKGETTTAVYEGVHWSEIADFLDTSEQTDIVLVASDDYEMSINSDMLNDPDFPFCSLSGRRGDQKRR